MNSRQTAREYALDQLQQGKISAAQANVLMVQIEGVLVDQPEMTEGEIINHTSTKDFKEELYSHPKKYVAIRA